MYQASTQPSFYSTSYDDFATRAAAQAKADQVVRELAKITDLMRWDDNGTAVVASDELSEAAKAALMEVNTLAKPDGQVVVSLKLHDKLGARGKLARYFGLYKDRVEITRPPKRVAYDFSMYTLEELVAFNDVYEQAALRRRTASP